MKQIAGIHHVTAIVGHPQENMDFYAAVLGLRLVKKTVNFDDPGTYHLYFGNEGGDPGTIITFFPWTGARQGKTGNGQVGVTSYAVPNGALSYWENRLTAFNIALSKNQRFGETYLTFSDPHGLSLEIVERQTSEKNHWTFGDISSDVAITGFAGATLLSSNPAKTIQLLEEEMGLKKVDEKETITRLAAYGGLGNMIDVKTTSNGRGNMGVGTVHHIAFRAKDDDDQLDFRQKLTQSGYAVTPVKDRNYFNSIYFREQGEILFEIATDPPGFSIDESVEELGKSLKLPPQYEQYREQLENALIPIEVRELDTD